LVGLDSINGIMELRAEWEKREAAILGELTSIIAAGCF
jgi:aryl carrier-like protein